MFTLYINILHPSVHTRWAHMHGVINMRVLILFSNWYVRTYQQMYYYLLLYLKKKKDFSSFTLIGFYQLSVERTLMYR